MRFEDSAPIQRRDAIAGGATDAQLRTLYTRGGWERFGRGLYLPATGGRELSDVSMVHRARIESAMNRLSPDAVVSHQSAAVVYGLPLWGTSLDQVHITRNRRGGGRSINEVEVHVGQFDENEILRCGGIAVTSLARTVLDLARTLPFEEAVVACDAAVHGAGLRGADDYGAGNFVVTTEDLEDELVRAKGRPGVGSARRVIRFLDAKCESPGESRSRVLFDRVSLEMPGSQGEIHDQYGVWVGRCDFFWEKHGVVGEFDGKEKYGRLLKVGEDASQAVFAEKVRANLIRRAGFHVVRWGWDDVDRPDALIDELRGLMDGCSCTRPKGTIRQAPPAFSYPRTH